MRLEFSGKKLGEISNIEGDGLWMNGRFIPGDEMTTELSEFFKFMTSPDSFAQDPPFPEPLLLEENWEILDGGRRQGISVPAIHPDGLISWRWRNLGAASQTKKGRKKQK